MGSGFASRSSSASAARSVALVLVGLAAVVAAWSAWPARARAGSPDVLYEERRVERIRRLGPLVESLQFVGNESYGARELLAYMKTKPSGFFRPTHYSRRALEGDVANLERFYASSGFLEAEVAVEDLVASEDGLSVDILVGLREGRRWSIAEVTVEGNRALDEETLRSLMHAVKGEPLAADAVEADREALLAAYARRSYLDARVEQVVERDDASATAVVRYTITEGPEASIGAILISGTDKTMDFVLEREFRFVEGGPFDPDLIGETQAALYRTGLFNAVVLEPAAEDTGLAVKRLLVRVRERPSGRFDFTAGYATLDGYEAGAEVSDRNVQGQATSAGLEGRLSELARDARATVGDPWFLGLPVGASAGVRYGWEDQETYTAETAAGEVALSKLFGRALTLRGGYTFERTLVLETSEEGGDLGANYTSDLMLGVSFDTRNDLLNATTGVLARAEVDIASSRFGGTNDFVRTGLSLKGFVPLRRRAVLAAAVELGWIEPGASPGDVPVNERYFAGGEASVRGFERNSLAPAAEDGGAEGGLGLLVARLELRVPVWKGLAVVGFADAGRAFAVPEDIRLSDLAVGAGAGLRYDTRIGVLRFDLATPVSRKGASEAYFSVGQAF